MGEGPGHPRHRRGHAAPPAAHHRPAAGYDPVYKVNPPLRPDEDVDALRDALADGTIDAVATDHAPHALHDKEHEFVDAAFGMVGLETALLGGQRGDGGLGAMTWTDVARAMSQYPARIAGLDGPRRPLAVGQPANITLVDPGAWSVDPSFAVPVAAIPLRRPDRPGPSCSTVAGRHADLLLDGPAAAVPRPARYQRAARAGGWPRLPRRGLRRRGETQARWSSTRHDRLPGDAHRPVYHRPGGRHDRSAHRQHGINDEDAESRRIWVAGFIVREPRACRPTGAGRYLDDELERARLSASRHRHPRAHPPSARARGEAWGISSVTDRRRRLLERVPEAPSGRGAELAGEVA